MVHGPNFTVEVILKIGVHDQFPYEFSLSGLIRAEFQESCFVGFFCQCGLPGPKVTGLQHIRVI